MFNLKKNYFDGIDEKGNAIILYSAEMKFLGVKIPYSSFILNDNEGTLEKGILNSSIIENNKIENKKLIFSGTWNALEKPIFEQLLKENSNILNWNCHTPKAKFNLDLKGKNYQGLGYAETLEMNFVPWKLPISELKWGRFLSENHCITWIEWIGKQPLKKVFWNGKEVENAEISDFGIEFKNENCFLKFENPVSIKNEKLLSMADKFPFLKLFFSKKFLQSHEMKFKSLSTLQSENQTEKGFSLYEKVLWEM